MALTLWYQVPPMNQSSSGDFQVWGIMMILTLGLVLLPFIPGLRSIPRWSACTASSGASITETWLEQRRAG